MWRSAHAKAYVGAACLLVSCAGSEIAPHVESKPAPVPPAAQPAVRHIGSPYAYEWFMRAEILRARRELGPALEAYRSALSSSDEDPHVLARYATALDEAGQTARAREVVARAFEQDPYSESAWLSRAAIAERHGALDEALEAYERAETVAPASPRAPLALAALLDRQHHPERARAVLARYEARVLPGTSGAQRARLRAAVLNENPEAAYAEARALGSVGSDDLVLIAQAAALVLDRGRCGLALDLLERFAERPLEAPLRLRALLACGRFGAAEELLRQTDPEVLGGLTAVARAYLTIGRASEALELAQAHHTVHPEDAQGTLLLADAQLATGALADAAESYASLVHGSNGAPARDGLARALTAAGLPDLARRVLAAQPAAAGAERQ